MLVSLKNDPSREKGRLRIFRNVDCVLTNHHKVQDTWANLKRVRGYKVFFPKKEGLMSKWLYNWNRKSDSKQNTFCIYWFLTKLQNVIVEV